MVHNRGIMHAAFQKGGAPLCKNQKAHMSTDIEQFRKEPLQCKRCLAKVAKADALAAKRAGKVKLTGVDKRRPDAVRTFMIVDAAAGRADVARYGNSEAVEVFGAEVMRFIDDGQRAIFHGRDGRRNLVVFDVLMAAMEHNRDLFITHNGQSKVTLVNQE
jgi:hypothetical protein